MLKIRADQPLAKNVKAAKELSFTAFRGECELAQIVFSAKKTPLRQVQVSSSVLRLESSPWAEQEGAKSSKAPGQTGERPVPKVQPNSPDSQASKPELRLYRQAYLDLSQASNAEGGTGLWPDPLIPTEDLLSGEKRRAFPVDVPAHRHQAVLVELCVPINSAPGTWRGLIKAKAEGQRWAPLPVQIQVLPSAIPATSSLPVSFGLSGKSLLLGHFGERREQERLTLVNRYAKSALEHRISLHGMSFRPPPHSISPSGELQIDFAPWDREIAPFMDGSALPSGARFSAIDLRTPEGLNEKHIQQYYRKVAEHFEERGWLSRLFAYVMDEPGKEDYPELKRRLKALSNTRIRRLVTSSFHPQLEGLVDIWAPNINCLFQKKRADEYCHTFAPPSRYQSLRKEGDELWWYQSCSSHGCNKGPFNEPKLDSYFSGWPRYVIDAPPAAARVMGWLAFLEGVGGELYFDTVFAYNFWDQKRAKSPTGSGETLPNAADLPSRLDPGVAKEPLQGRLDPWEWVNHFGGNGDGTLFYPGRPEVIGGSTHVPVESLRLKYIRKGLEDYELLKQLAGTGEQGERRAKQLARRLITSPYAYSSQPELWEQTRAELVSALNQAPEENSAPMKEERP